MDFRHYYNFPEDYTFSREVWLAYFDFAITIPYTVDNVQLTRRQRRKFREE